MHRRNLLAATAEIASLGSLAATISDRTASTSAPTLSPLATHDVRGAMDFVTDEDAGLAYVAASNGFVVVDVSDPADPSTVVEFREPLSDHENGPLHGIRDVKLHGDRLLVAGQEWANAKGGAGVVLYDVADPASPEQVAVHETMFPVHNATLDEEAAYLTASQTERWPVVVLDAAEDALDETARWSVVDVDDRWTDVKPGVRRVHDVHLDGDLLYVANWDAGTRVLDVSDPGDPTEIAVLGGRTPNEVLNADHYDPEAPLGPEILELPGNSTTMRTNDGGDLLAVPKEAVDMTSETDRRGGPGPIEVWDVSDLDDPEELLTLAPPDLDGTDVGNAKNCEWRGDRLYAAWRKCGARVYDLSDPSSPLLLGENTEFDAHTTRALANGFVSLQNTGPNGGEEKPGRLFTFPEPGTDDATPAGTGSPLNDPGPTRTGTDTTAAPGTTTTTTTGAMDTDTSTAASPPGRSTTAGSTGTVTPGFSVLAGVAGGTVALLVSLLQRPEE